MKTNLLITLIILWTGIINTNLTAQNSLPAVFADEPTDLTGQTLEMKAAKAHKTLQIPGSMDEWQSFRKELKTLLLEKTGADRFPGLPLNYHETKEHKLPGLTVKNIYFQTRPGIYATANLYIPDGTGPFPGVVTMMGHSSNGKLYDVYQAIGHSLALNGYVSLHIDPWGAGERTTIHGKFEYHGANLGASLMNIGETLMGMQITDNMRAVDMLCSLPYVDCEKIGATGASGGGNQTMWLAAMDERVKAAVPVVSVGTFQSYVMNSNCICETLPDGLTFTEEAAVLGLVAPRALKICNGMKDSNRAFYPSEMLRSYDNARPVFKLYDADENLSYQIFNKPHGYWPEIREAMLGWFDLHLKGTGTGAPKSEKPITLLSEEELMVFRAGDRNADVKTTAEFCRTQGKILSRAFLDDRNINASKKIVELKNLLKINDNPVSYESRELPVIDGWQRFVIESADGRLIPVLLKEADEKSTEYVIIFDPAGKGSIEGDIIEKHINSNKNICIVDLWGTGEVYSPQANRISGSLSRFHTLGRSALWLGHRVQGIWAEQINITANWLKKTKKAGKISVETLKDGTPAALFAAVTGNNISSLILNNAPVSYVFDDPSTINYFSMGIHIPGMLKWGDISLAAALSGAEINFIDPVTITGRELSGEEINNYKGEFILMNNRIGKKSRINLSAK
jgi:hypothetical protein